MPTSLGFTSVCAACKCPRGSRFSFENGPSLPPPVSLAHLCTSPRPVLISACFLLLIISWTRPPPHVFPIPLHVGVLLHFSVSFIPLGEHCGGAVRWQLCHRRAVLPRLLVWDVALALFTAPELERAARELPSLPERPLVVSLELGLPGRPCWAPFLWASPPPPPLSLFCSTAGENKAVFSSEGAPPWKETPVSPPSSGLNPASNGGG